MSESIVSSSLDYSSKNFNHSSYLYTKVVPNSGATSVTTSTSAVSGNVTFTMPAKCLNLSKSYLSFDMTIPAQNTGFSWLSGTVASSINRIVLSTVGSNQILADISNCGSFINAVAYPSTKKSDLDSKASGVTLLGKMNETSVASAQLTTVSDITKSNSAINYTGQLYTSGSAGDAVTIGDVAYTSPRYLFGQTTTNTDCFLSVRFNLDAFKHSIFSIDKLLYFAGEPLSLDIYFEAANKYLFASQSATAPDTGAAAATSAPVISNLGLYCAVEQNLSIQQALIDRVMREGLTMPIPFVFGNKVNVANSTVHSITQTISKANGNRLLFVCWAPYQNTESSKTCKAHTTYQLSSYNSFLNSIPVISNSGVNVLTGEHFTYNKENLRGSCVQGLVAYNNNFIHVDNFCGMSLADLIENETVYNGIDLAEAQQWQLQLTTSASTSLNHYLFFVTQRQLTIAPNAIIIS